MVLEQCRFQLLQMKAFAMMGSIAVGDDSFDMLFGRISHIPFPSVFGILCRQFSHILIPVGLGKD